MRVHTFRYGIRTPRLAVDFLKLTSYQFEETGRRFQNPCNMAVMVFEEGSFNFNELYSIVSTIPESVFRQEIDLRKWFFMQTVGVQGAWCHKLKPSIANVWFSNTCHRESHCVGILVCIAYLHFMDLEMHCVNICKTYIKTCLASKKCILMPRHNRFKLNTTTQISPIHFEPALKPVNKT